MNGFKKIHNANIKMSRTVGQSCSCSCTHAP